MEIKEGFVICTTLKKKKLLEEEKGFKNYIFLSYSELKSKIYGDVKKSALFLLMEKYSLSFDLAKEYIKYIPFVEDKCYNDLKLDSLVSARNFLNKNDLLIKDDFFTYRLPQFPVTFLENKETKEDKKIKDFLRQYTNVTEIKGNNKEYKPIVYEYESIEDEIYDLCNNIVSLNKKGISYSKMHIVNADTKYIDLLKRVSKTYQIPFDFKAEKNILHTSFAKELLQLLKVSKSFDEILEKIKDSIFVDTFISLVKEYELKDKNPALYYEFFKSELKNISYPKNIYTDMVDLSFEEEYEENDYVFYIGLNQGVSPKIYKDEEYLSDKELEQISVLTSFEKNKEEKRKLIELLTKTKNIHISYALKEGVNQMAPSGIINYLGLKTEKGNKEYGFSKEEDNIRFAKALSVFDKIRDKDIALEKYDISNIPYKKYDNTFKGINKKNMEERFNDATPLSFAYSNIKLYFECPFHFYLERILNIGEYESKTATRLGTYSHAVMEDSYKDDFNFSESVLKNKNEVLKDLNEADYAKDEFYFEQMKSVLSSLLEFNRKHEEDSSLKTVECEAHIKYQDGSVLFHGFIDKLMYTEINGEIYAAIIDYKTGKDIITLKNVYDGFHLQLPSYMFLLSKYEKFKGKKLHIIGIYLQKVNMIALDNTIDIVAQREKAFRLQGYTIKDISLIPLLDPSFNNSDYINVLKTTQKGSFSTYSKVISKEDEDFLIDLVDELIKKAHKGVMNAKFDIAPKRIKGSDQSCTFCKYKDICFKSYKDYIDLEERDFPQKEE